MTWRGAALVAATLLIVAAGAAQPVLVVVGLLAALFVGVLIVVDGRRAPGRRRLQIERRHHDVLSVGVANSIEVSVTGPACAARVRVEAAPAAHLQPDAWRTRLPATLQGTLTPRSRGELRLGRTVVRAEGPLRLGWRQTVIGDVEAVPVDADIAAVRVYEALARRGQLAELGVRTMRLRSEGTEFERIREAVADDPLRSINWKATARTGRLMATELMPERAQPVIACIDHGRLMGVGAGELTKLDHAINAALLLLHVALRSGDRAGLMTFCDGVTRRIAPATGAAQLRVILDSLRPLRPAETEADYVAAFADYDRWQRRRALVVIFTDVMDPDQGRALAAQCAHLSRRHLLLVVTVRDPAVDDIARVRPLAINDVYARAVASGLVSDREDTLRLLRSAGINVVDADARTLSPRLVNRYLELKRAARL